MKCLNRFSLFKYLAALVISLTTASVFAYDPSAPRTFVPGQKPAELQNVGISEKRGDTLDLGLTFTDEQGREVHLGDYYRRGKPVIISLVYYDCPNLCTLHLNGLVDVFKNLPWTPGQEFEAVAVSIDPKETPELAARKKSAYLQALGRVEASQGWHFLTGKEDQIKKLAEQLGFKYQWNEQAKQWAHASAAVITTPKGKISRYLHGVVFDPKTLRLSLVEASEGKIGTIVDSFVLYCFHFDSSQSKYVIYAFNIMRIGGGLVLLCLAILLGSFWLRQRKQLKGVPS